jgi:hypothetical protein
MFAGLAIAIFAVASVAALYIMARRDHDAAMAARARLLDSVVTLFDEAKLRVAGDGFPVLTGRLPDRRQITIELIPDTMVMRRLPQLWLVVTLSETMKRARPSFGALARPTGSEFYSRIDELPERIEPPPGLDSSIMIRGNAPFGGVDANRAGEALRLLFADKRVKEVMVTPKGVRIVRQASQGERGAHLLLRQVRFPIAAVQPELVRTAIEEADAMRGALDWAGSAPAKLSA